MLGAALLSACAGMKTPEEISGDYELRTVAVAAVRGGGKQSAAIIGELSRSLGKSGVRAVPLEGLDDLLADSAFSLKKEADPHLLNEIRRATDADAVVILELDHSRRGVGVSVLDARNGAALLETDANSGGKRFQTVGDVAAAAARAMAPLIKRGKRRRDDGSSLEESPPADQPSTLGLGLNVFGGQLAYQPSKEYRGELRYQIGKSGSGSDQVSASAAGLRGYRLFWTDGATHPYLGLEAAYLMGRDRSSHSVAGEAGGAFIGIERRIASRLWIGLDAGPYFLHLRENEFHMTDASLQFVANTSLTFFLF